MSQYEHLKNLQALSTTPFQISKDKHDNGKFRPGRKTPLAEDKLPVDHRTVLSNEVIFELDSKGWTYNVKHAKAIVEALEELQVPHYIYATGGKGVHISCYFKTPELKKADKDVLRKAMSYGFGYKQIRLWYLQEILTQYVGISEKLIGPGNIIDTAPIAFNELNEGTHLIRACGGRKQTIDPDTLEKTQHYKTLLLKTDLKGRKPSVTNRANVRYPESIKPFDLPVDDFISYVHAYNNKCEEEKRKPYEKVTLPEGYLNLACVHQLRSGLGTGERSIGAQLLSQAIILDKADPKTFLEEYVHNCDQAGSTFTIHEANNWHQWTASQPEVFFNHALIKDIGLCDGNCDYNKGTKKTLYKALERSDILERIEKYLDISIRGEKRNKMLIFLLLISCKFDTKPDYHKIGDPRPQSIILSSLSASGKTWVTKQILKLFGKENVDYYTFSRMTPAVLNYFQEIDMTGKILFVEELQGLDVTSNQLRLWISEGKIKLAGVEKKKGDDGVERNAIDIKESLGQPTFITGTAEDEVDEQMNNRSWILSMDISKEQTAKVLDMEDDLMKGNIIFDKEEERLLQDALQELQSRHVLVPFLDHELLGMPSEDVRARRDYKKLITLICCSALLHQYQRETLYDDKGDDYLLASIEDYDTARKYSKDIMESLMVGLTNQQMDVLNLIRDSSFADEFSSGNVQKLTGWSQGKCWSILKQLEEASAIIMTGVIDGRTNIYGVNRSKEFGVLALPTGMQLLRKIALKSFSESKTEISKNGVLFEENGLFSTFKSASDLWRKLPKNSKNTRKIVIGTPKKILLKALETGDTSALPAEFEFGVTYFEGTRSALTGFFASSSKNDTKLETVQQIGMGKIGGSQNRSLSDANSILEYIDSSSEKLVDELTLIELGATETLLKKLKKEGEIFESKPGRVMRL